MNDRNLLGPWIRRFMLVDSVKQDVRFTDKHLGRSAEVIVAGSGVHGCRSVRVVSG